jgi:hypothetical protein
MRGDLVEITHALACGADVNRKNEQDNFKSALHIACQEVCSGIHSFCLSLSLRSPFLTIARVICWLLNYFVNGMQMQARWTHLAKLLWIMLLMRVVGLSSKVWFVSLREIWTITRHLREKISSKLLMKIGRTTSTNTDPIQIEPRHMMLCPCLYHHPSSD